MSFIPLCAMLPHTEQLKKSEEQAINIPCFDDEKKTVTPQKKIAIPVSIVSMSETLTNMITDLGGTITNNKGTISINMNNIEAIPIELYSCSTITHLCEVLKDFSTNKTLNTQNIPNYTLEKLIILANAFDYFGFSANKYLAAEWDKKIKGEIYQQCKDRFWHELEQEVIPLYPNPLNRDLTCTIFCKPIINKIKFELMKRAFTDDRKIELSTTGTDNSVFSPDGTMLASTLFIDQQQSSLLIRISLLKNNTVTYSYTNRLNNIDDFWGHCAQFSNNNTKLIIGNGNTILVYDIDPASGVINTKPIQTIQVPPNNDNWSRQISLSQNGKLMACYNGNDLILWELNKDGTIDDLSRKALFSAHAETLIISPIQFNDDNTICVIFNAKNSPSSSLHIFDPQEPANNLEVDIGLILFGASFYKHDKKFAAIIKNHDNKHPQKSSIYIYDFSNTNTLSIKFVSHFLNYLNNYRDFSIILDDTAIITTTKPSDSGPGLLLTGLLLIDINNNNDHLIPLWKAKHTYRSFSLSSDNKKIVFNPYIGNYILYNLLTPEEEAKLANINKIDIEPLLLLDRVVRLGKPHDIIALIPQIPQQIIDLLEKIGLVDENMQLENAFAKIAEGQKMKNYVEMAASIGKKKEDQSINIKNPETIAAALKILLEQQPEQPEHIPAAAIPLQIAQAQEVSDEAQDKQQPQPQPENNEQQSKTWKEFFANIYESIRSLLSGVINYYSQ